MPPIRAAVYLRVSTDGQASDGESLEMQEARARELCEANGWELLPVYLDVMSGRKDKRPALSRLEHDLKSGAFSVLICYKVDRLGRTRRKLHDLLETIQQRGIRLVSLTQQIDSATASGRLMLSVLIDFAVYEIEQSGERISDTLLHIAKQGRAPSGNPPYGYRYEPIQRVLGEDGREVKIPGRLVINEAEAEGVRFAFDAYRRFGSLSQTAAALNHAGYRTRWGKAWAPETVRFLTTNPAYGAERALRRWRAKGSKSVSGAATLRSMRDWELVPAAHEPIVPTDVAREVRERYWESRLESPRTRTAGSPWSGLVVCQFCGSKLRRTHPKATGPALRCHGRTYGVCEMRTVPEAWLSHAIIGAISKALDDAKGIQQALEGQEAPKPLALAQVPDRERQIAALRRKLDKLEFRFDEDIIDGDTYLRERKAILAAIDTAQSQAPRPKSVARFVLPEGLDEVWSGLLESQEGIEAARQLIRLLVSRVVVGHQWGLVVLNSVEGLDLPEQVEVERWPLGVKVYKAMGRWHKDVDACVSCGTTERRHYAKERCRPCYHKAWNQKE